jgi:THO complex subunit 4
MLIPHRAVEVGTKLRIDNVHYELGEEDLQRIFRRHGPITKLEIRYDRAGRSEGVAFVTYKVEDDARAALADFDGANAAGK